MAPAALISAAVGSSSGLAGVMGVSFTVVVFLSGVVVGVVSGALAGAPSVHRQCAGDISQQQGP